MTAVTITFGFPDRGLGATYSGGGWETNLPLTQLNRDLIAAVARSTDATLANTRTDIDLGAAQQIGLVALINHNLTAAALIRVRAYSDAGYTTLEYDSGWIDAWPDTYESGTIEWEDPEFWAGTTTDTGGTPAVALHEISSAPSWRYWRVEIDDTTNPAGYVQLGRVLMARPVSIGAPNVGGEIGHYTGTQVNETSSGIDLIDARPIRRELAFSVGLLADDDRRRLFDLERLTGTANTVFVLWGGDALDQRRYSFLGRIMDLPAFRWSSPLYQDKAYVIREIV